MNTLPGIWSDRSTNWATTTALYTLILPLTASVLWSIIPTTYGEKNIFQKINKIIFFLPFRPPNEKDEKMESFFDKTLLMSFECSNDGLMTAYKVAIM